MRGKIKATNAVACVTLTLFLRVQAYMMYYNALASTNEGDCDLRYGLRMRQFSLPASISEIAIYRAALSPKAFLKQRWNMSG